MRTVNHRRLGMVLSVATFLVLLGPGGQAIASTVDLNAVTEPLRSPTRQSFQMSWSNVGAFAMLCVDHNGFCKVWYQDDASSKSYSYTYPCMNYDITRHPSLSAESDDKTVFDTFVQKDTMSGPCPVLVRVVPARAG